MLNEVPDYCYGCELYLQNTNIKKIIKKWVSEADSIGMSDTDDPYFAKGKIREFIKDLEGGS